MARPIKLQFYDHPVTCPHCRTDVVFTSMMEQIIVARRTCPSCKRELLIEDGKAVRLPSDGGEKKPSKPVRSSKSIRERIGRS